MSHGDRVRWAAAAHLVAMASLLASCSAHRVPAAGSNDALELAPDLELRALAPGVWLHTTWRDLPGGARVPSNGLVVADGEGFLLVDSAWGDDETEALVEGIERELGGPVTRLVATHFHDDRLSGGAYLAGRGIAVSAHPMTLRLAGETGALGEPLPALVPVGAATRVGPVEVFYPGPGHAPDNVVVWVPDAHVLFGGCLVRPADSSSLGNIGDADLDRWADSVARVEARYPRARTVVPGHGPPVPPEVLEHTRRLVDEVSRPPRP